MSRYPTVVAVPDLHEPWSKKSAVKKLYDHIDRINPDHVIQLGDALDRFSFSRFAKHPIGMTPEEEIDEGHQCLGRFWANVRLAAPKARLIQLSGNHEARLVRACLERFPEALSLLSRAQGDFYSFKGVETIHDHRHELEIGGVVYCHGWLGALGAHMRYLGKPVVHGHTHRGGFVAESWHGRTIWELDCGYLGDKEAVPLMYGPTKTVKWVLGYGLVDRFGGRFVGL